jgi:hypothetical protein
MISYERSDAGCRIKRKCLPASLKLWRMKKLNVIASPGMKEILVEGNNTEFQQEKHNNFKSERDTGYKMQDVVAKRRSSHRRGRIRDTKLKTRMANNQLPTPNFQVTFGLGARYLEVGSWKLVIGYSFASPITD